MSRVTLASASSIRADMLRRAGVDLDVAISGVDETAIKSALLADDAPPREMADVLADAKAVKVSRKRPGLVIGADSVLEFDGRLYDKPQDMAEARRHLTAFRGKAHRLHSAAVIAEDGAPVWRHVATATLHVRDFTDDFLERYINAEGETLLSSVGCYRLEGLGVQLFNRIEGDYFAILGLPLLPVLDYLRLRGATAS
jgi:septum formation protein